MLLSNHIIISWVETRVNEAIVTLVWWSHLCVRVCVCLCCYKWSALVWHPCLINAAWWMLLPSLFPCLTLPFMSILILRCICYQFSIWVCAGTRCSSFRLQSEEPLYGSIPFRVLFLHQRSLLLLCMRFLFHPPPFSLLVYFKLAYLQQMLHSL